MKLTVGRALHIGIFGFAGIIFGAAISPFYSLYMAFYQHIEGEGTYLFPSANHEPRIASSNSYWQKFKEAIGFMHPEENSNQYDFSLTSSLKILAKGLLKSIPRLIESIIISPFVFAKKATEKLIRNFTWFDEMDSSMTERHGTIQTQKMPTSSSQRLHQQFSVNNAELNETKLTEVLKQIPNYNNHKIMTRDPIIDAVLDKFITFGILPDDQTKVIAVEFNNPLDAFEYFYRTLATPLFTPIYNYLSVDKTVYLIPCKGKPFNDLSNVINQNIQEDIKIKNLVSQLGLVAGRQRRTVRDGDQRWLVLDFNTQVAALNFMSDQKLNNCQLDRYLANRMNCERYYDKANKFTDKENVWSVSILMENTTLDELLNSLRVDVANKQSLKSDSNPQASTQIAANSLKK